LDCKTVGQASRLSPSISASVLEHFPHPIFHSQIRSLAGSEFFWRGGRASLRRLLREALVVPTSVNFVNIHAATRPIIISGECERPAGAIKSQRFWTVGFIRIINGKRD